MLPETVEENLRRYGWTFERKTSGEATTWHTGFCGEHGIYSMRIYLRASSLSFEVSPTLGQKLPWQQWPDLLMTLLELNDDMQLAKLSLKPCGSMMMSCELPAVGLTYEAMEHALGIMGYYVDEVALMLAGVLNDLGLETETPSFS